MVFHLELCTLISLLITPLIYDSLILLFDHAEEKDCSQWLWNKETEAAWAMNPTLSLL